MQVVDKEAVQYGFSTGKKALISLLPHERAHVMAIELASIRTSFAHVKVRMFPNPTWVCTSRFNSFRVHCWVFHASGLLHPSVWQLFPLCEASCAKQQFMLACKQCILRINISHSPSCKAALQAAQVTAHGKSWDRPESPCNNTRCDMLLVLQAALLQADGGALTFEMLNPLSRAVPEAKEAADIRLYLQVQPSACAFSFTVSFAPSALVLWWQFLTCKGVVGGNCQNPAWLALSGAYIQKICTWCMHVGFADVQRICHALCLHIGLW